MRNYYYHVSDPYKKRHPMNDFQLCKKCTEIWNAEYGKIISTHRGGHFIRCRYCERIYDDKGNFYTNTFNPGEPIDIYVLQEKKFVYTTFLRKSFETKHFSIGETEEGEMIHGIARPALNPHTD